MRPLMRSGLVAGRRFGDAPRSGIRHRLRLPVSRALPRRHGGRSVSADVRQLRVLHTSRTTGVHLGGRRLARPHGVRAYVPARRAVRAWARRHLPRPEAPPRV